MGPVAEHQSLVKILRVVGLKAQVHCENICSGPDGDQIQSELKEQFIVSQAVVNEAVIIVLHCKK